jgi:N-acetylglucosamine-6-phosphate deacetylase
MPDHGNEIAISAPRVFDGERFLSDHCVIVRQQTVAQLLPVADCPPGLQRLALASGTLAPGLIDLQVNGGGDALFNNAPCEATLDTMAAAHRATGTTSMFPTLLSDTRATQQQAVDAVRAARASGNPGILGIHLEGPFFAPGRAGAHRADLLRQPEPGDIAWLCTLQDLPTLVTLAPEQLESGQIRQLAGSGIRVCAGHTNASSEQLDRAVTEGLRGVTHLFNAMSPLTGRAPGAVGAALGNDLLWAGIIADGHHVHPANIRLAHRLKPRGQLVLVTDAMATVGGSRKAFALYGEEVRESDGKLVNAAGVLAGSAIGLIDAVRYCATVVELELAECLRMASLYPAAIAGLDGSLGRLAPGYRADLIHFDDHFRVHHSWLAGQHRVHNPDVSSG